MHFENVLKLILVMVAHSMCKYTKTHLIVHFKGVNCMACELYLKEFFKKCAFLLFQINEEIHTPFCVLFWYGLCHEENREKNDPTIL